MLTLLLETQKKDLKKEYMLRLFIVLLCSGILISVIWIFALLPSYILSNTESQVLSERAQVALASELAEDKRSLFNQSVKFNNKLALFKTIESYYQPTDIIYAITQDQAIGISLSNIDLSDMETETPLVGITGVASTREGLKEFTKMLSEQEMFEPFELPLSSFVKEKDIPFTINLKLIVLNDEK